MKQRIMQEIKRLQRKKRIFKIKLFFTVTLPFLLFAIGFRILKKIIRIKLREAASKAGRRAPKSHAQPSPKEQDVPVSACGPAGSESESVKDMAGCEAPPADSVDNGTPGQAKDGDGDSVDIVIEEDVEHR